jgi:hypothetical protein
MTTPEYTLKFSDSMVEALGLYNFTIKDRTMQVSLPQLLSVWECVLEEVATLSQVDISDYMVLETMLSGNVLDLSTVEARKRVPSDFK